MFHRSGRPVAETSIAVEFSERDREDAARLLGLIVGRDEDAPDEWQLRRIAEAVLQDRKLREEAFGGGMFGETGWELLLSLYSVDKVGPRLTIARLTQIAGGPATTVLRWLDYLENQEFIERERNPNDARSLIVSLTDRGRAVMASYLSQMITPRVLGSS